MGNADPDPGTTFQIFPNPAEKELHFLAEEGPLPLSVQLFDLTGKMVRQETWPKGERRLNLDLTGLRNGFYVARINLKDGLYCHRFLKE